MIAIVISILTWLKIRRQSIFKKKHTKTVLIRYLLGIYYIFHTNIFLGYFYYVCICAMVVNMSFVFPSFLIFKLQLLYVGVAEF